MSYFFDIVNIAGTVAVPAHVIFEIFFFLVHIQLPFQFAIVAFRSMILNLITFRFSVFHLFSRLDTWLFAIQRHSGFQLSVCRAFRLPGVC